MRRMRAASDDRVCNACAFFAFGVRQIDGCECQLIFIMMSAIRSCSNAPVRSEQSNPIKIPTLMSIQCQWASPDSAYAISCVIGKQPKALS